MSAVRREKTSVLQTSYDCGGNNSLQTTESCRKSPKEDSLLWPKSPDIDAIDPLQVI